MIEIKHRYTDDVLCTSKAETLQQAVEQHKAHLSETNLCMADLRGANLSEANLCGADLSETNLHGANLRDADLRGADLRGAHLRRTRLAGANLTGANLCGADLYGADLCEANLRGANIEGEVLARNPLVVAGIRYWCLITEGYMRLGCKRYTHAEWAAFGDEEIAAMDWAALKFWQQWQAPLLALCTAHAEGEAK